MITKINHVNIFVLNQESAYDFYVNKLGFKVHTDMPMGPKTRWLTVTTPEQPDLELILMPVEDNSMFKGDSANQMKELIQNGTFGFGILKCDDLEKTYEDLAAKGVVFTKTPTKEFYGYEAVFKDDSGNWFSLKEREND